jgi:preprotein translocase subunit SecE
MKKIKQFLKEIQAELKKVVWPTRTELINSTILVIISTAFFALIIGAFDQLFVKILSAFLR